MKKTLFVGVLFLTLLVGIGTTQSNSERPTDEMSQLLLANIDALTSIEDAESGGSQFEYPDGYPFTTTCNVAIGKNWWGGTDRCEVVVITCQGGGSGCNSKKCPVHPNPSNISAL